MLALATKSEGPWGPGPHSAVPIRYGWRAQALLARVETFLPVLTPGMVPPPMPAMTAQSTEAEAPAFIPPEAVLQRHPKA